MLIYVLRDNQQTGPFTEAETRAQLATGAVTPQTLVWWQGMAEWQPLGQTHLAVPPPTGGTPPHVAPPVTAPPSLYATAGVEHYSGLAVMSFVCGALGFFCISAPVAIITGHLARSGIRRNPTLKGSGMALAGLVLGYFWTILVVLGIILALTSLRSGVSTSYFKFQEDSTEDNDSSPPSTSPPTTNAPGT
jgi:hypothetical protein